MAALSEQGSLEINKEPKTHTAHHAKAIGLTRALAVSEDVGKNGDPTLFVVFDSEESSSVRMECPAWCSGGRRPLIAGWLSLQRIEIVLPVTRQVWDSNL